MFQELKFRWLCWRLGICYTHLESKECDIYGPAYCQICCEEGNIRRAENIQENRLDLINQIKRYRSASV